MQPKLVRIAILAGIAVLVIFYGYQGVGAVETNHVLSGDGIEDDCLACHADEVMLDGDEVTMFSMASSDPGFTYTEQYAIPASYSANRCKVCHVASGSNVHHLIALNNNTECMECHGLTMNQSTGGFELVNHPTNCFLNCHFPSFYRNEDGFLELQTTYALWENGWSLSPAFKSKTGAAHHGNWGISPPESPDANDCGRCHANEWDDELNAIVTVPVEGSANNYGRRENNVDNIIINVSPDLVNDISAYDYADPEASTLRLDAYGSVGDITTIKWTLGYLKIYGWEFEYLFKWYDAGETAVIKLEMWDADGRYAKQNVVVNIH